MFCVYNVSRAEEYTMFSGGIHKYNLYEHDDGGPAPEQATQCFYRPGESVEHVVQIIRTYAAHIAHLKLYVVAGN